MAAVHEKKKPFQCPICDSTFAHKSSLVKHIDAIHEGKETNFSSIEAKLWKNVDIKDSNGSKIDLSAEVHHDNVEFFCSKCKINFPKEMNLTVHNATAHSLIVVLDDVIHTRNK